MRDIEFDANTPLTGAKVIKSFTDSLVLILSCHYPVEIVTNILSNSVPKILFLTHRPTACRRQTKRIN